MSGEQTDLLTYERDGYGAFAEAGADFSVDMRYRWRLQRQWRPGANRCLFVMLNPSTADILRDDPTIRRCVAFARGWGFAALDVCNLFGYVTPDPRELLRQRDPVGQENDRILMETAAHAAGIVLAWGKHGTFMGRGAAVRRLLRDLRPSELGTCRNGEAKHPLYLPREAILTPSRYLAP